MIRLGYKGFRESVRCFAAAREALARRAACTVAVRAEAGTGEFQVRSDGSVRFAARRTSSESWAKIHDEAAVMTPTHTKVA